MVSGGSFESIRAVLLGYQQGSTTVARRGWKAARRHWAEVGGRRGEGGVGVCGKERVVNQLGAGWAMEFSCNSGIRRGRERKSGGWLWVWLWVVVVDGVTRGGLGWQV